MEARLTRFPTGIFLIGTLGIVLSPLASLKKTTFEDSIIRVSTRIRGDQRLNETQRKEELLRRLRELYKKDEAKRKK